ncbi:MAG: NERD domain-containing protein [Clostridium celatum]|nr:NERD domain-containing protein [Clostridium celatum]MDU2121005.1 NERD domain-containing protein [Clostridium celatum]MDU4978487.1 NERD domain-containing protein [Clostridium celatum]
MLLVLVNIIWIIIKLIFYMLYFLIKAILKTFVFILKKTFLRFTFLIISIGYLLHINFNILATIYFIYLMNLFAIRFNIYNKIYTDLNYIYNKIRNFYKVSRCLKSLKNDGIILNNIYLENNNDDYCSIDELVITNGGIFAIKTLNYPYDDYTEFNFSKILSLNNIKSKNDKIIDLSLINSISEECLKCYNILQDILSCDIPITNIIAIPQENCVVKEGYSLDTPIVTAKDLPYYIKNKINKNVNYSPLLIKEDLLENKLWTFDIAISRLQNFLNHSKVIILFFTVFLSIYYVYITFISYIFFKIITL